MSLSLFAAPNDASSPRVRRWRTWRLLLRIGGWTVLGLWSLVLLGWLTLHWGILPRLDEWRPQFETQASRALGLPVQIGRIEVRSSGWVPAFKLHDVVLRDARGREALRLPQISAALAVPALLSMQLRFDQLLIDGPRVEVRRDPQGRLRVAGIDVDGEAMGSGADLIDWFFEQHEFVVRGGSVRWVDELRGAPPLELADVQLVVRNRLNRHDMRLDATPPAGWGQRFKLVARARQPLLARPGDWQRWRGSVYADFPQVLVQELRRHADLPFQLSQGEGALRGWVDFSNGLPQGGTLDLALRDVSVRLASDLEPVALAQVGGRVVVERQADGVKVSASRFAFQTAEGKAWPEGSLVVAWNQKQVLSASELAQASASHPVTGGQFSAERLDLALMADLAERLPIGTGVRRLLAALNPQGAVSGLAASWKGPLDAPTQYDVRAEVTGMAIDPADSPEPGGIGRPGWRGASLSFQGNQSGGQARLAIDDGALVVPGVFEKPVVPLRRFGSQLAWKFEPVAGGRPRVELKVNGARFENDDVQGELEATWRTGAGEGFAKGARLPGVLELSGKLAQGKAAQVARYLPLGIPLSARDYVRRAVVGGKVPTASFRVKGDLWDFPFVQRNDGEFRITAQAQDVTLAYVPSTPASGAEPAWNSPWPAFTGVDGELVFDRTSMQIRNARGRIWGVELSDVQGGIRNLTEHAALEIEGRARGPASDLLRYVGVTPVGEWIGGALARATAEGAADLKLALNLPFEHLDQSIVKGGIQLSGGDVRIRPDLPLLAGARGRVDFTQKGVTVAGTARAYGGEASIEGGTQADGSMRFSANGTASAEGLRRATDLGPVSRWAARAEGQAPYRLQLAIVRGYPELLVTSPMTGLSIDLPAPLHKSAETSLPLRVQFALTPESRAGARPQRDTVRVDVGSVLAANYLRELSTDDARVLRGALAVNASLPEMVPGVRAVVDLAQANLDAWSAVTPSLMGAGGTGPSGGQAATPAPGALAAKTLDEYLPQAITLKADTLTLASRKLTHVVLDLGRLGPAAASPPPPAASASQASRGWRARVDADQLSGEITYTEPRGATEAGRVRARLARLSLPQTEADSVEGLLDQAPSSVPEVDLEVQDFELRGRKLGKLTVDAVNRSRSGVASAREWRLNRLVLATPEGDLVASGQWGNAASADTRRRMGLDFQWQVRDAGALLQRLGFGAVIRGGKGLLKGEVSWAGSPLGLDLPTLGGQMNLALDAGQFLKAEPGAGRLLGVLSLQALPRRLVLDFRDVFQEGFAFDNITGDLQVAQGVARTNNLRMRGVQAAVLMEGQADVLRETQDLRVIVVPEINAGTASLAYAVINPALGLGTFLGQLLLRGPLAEAGTREFHVTGSWADPRVTQVARHSAEPASAPSAPTAASAPPRAP